MNAVHRLVSSIFDALLTPLERLGKLAALVIVSGVFGVLALLLFKQISWQGGIRATKDKIKGHMIAIRIYQDDLGIVFMSVMKVVLRNFQYLALNFGPILPLLVPFVLIASQLVVRYGFAPLAVVEQSRVASMLPGRGTMLEVRMKAGRQAEVAGLTVELPPGLEALSPLARNTRDGIAVMEFAATAPGTSDVVLRVSGQLAGAKQISAGDNPPRSLQPERVSSFWASLLWPAEPTLPSDSPIDYVRLTYPEREFGVLPRGPFGVLLTFFLASVVFGIAVLKPLNSQI